MPLAVASVFPRSRITLGLDLKGGIDLVYQIDINSVAKEDNPADAVTRSVEIIRNRIDMYGIAEPSIKAQEGHRIRIQLPGVKDPENVKKLIQSTAMLKFHLVKDQNMTATQLEPIDSTSELVLFEAGNRDAQGRWYKLKREAEVTGRDLKYAQVSFDEMGAPIVHLSFNPDGAAKFAQVTGQHIGEQLAIVLDNKVHSAPTIQSRITGGLAQITGHFTLEEAQNLAIVLRAGALPASLILLESRVVGPTLGEESIKAGARAGFVGVLAVVIFMISYYKFCGFLADLAVMFNTLIVFSFLVAFGGTLTLPGIAGLILSVGMAVDTNIIIYERIRDELRTGKTVRAAIDAGFDRVLACIIDSHVTAILTVAVLYTFGSGPIRGFATTLGIGLLANLFTAVVCVKLALDLIFSRSKATTLSV
ncbi:MAG: protein translocase subunit SecD [Candidatus Riflebacteria bacterium]|nr:protein translocase subunit SecD [Candidatus Riflebacteria bacterium]